MKLGHCVQICLFMLSFSVAVWGQKPVIFPGGVVNAASYAASNIRLGNGQDDYGRGISGGSIASIFGARLAPATAIAGAGRLPTELAGTSVLVRGVSAPLFYVSPWQINFQVPSVVGWSPDVVVHTAEGDSEPYRMDGMNYGGALGIFTQDGSGCGPGSVLNVERGGMVSVNSPANSVSPGDYISIYGTGMGYVYDGPPDGIPTPTSPLSSPAYGSAVVFDWAQKILPSWSGRAPGMIGVDQTNVRVPGTVREGCAVPLQTNYGPNGDSQPVTISVRVGGGPCVDPPSAAYGQVLWEKLVTTKATGTVESDSLNVSLQASPGQQPPPLAEYLTGGGSDNLIRLGPSCPVPGYESLDAGAVAAQGPGISATPAAPAPLTEGRVSGLWQYRAVLPSGAIKPGSFQVTAAGGAEVGAFQSRVDIGAGIQVTTPLAGAVLPMLQPITVNWTGGDANTWVIFTIVSHYGNYDGSAKTHVRANAGTATLGVPGRGPGVGDPFDAVLEVVPDPAQIVPFSAAGLSLGGRHTWKYTYRFEHIMLK